LIKKLNGLLLEALENAPKPYEDATKNWLPSSIMVHTFPYPSHLPYRNEDEAL